MMTTQTKRWDAVTVTRATAQGIMIGSREADWPTVVAAAQQDDPELAEAYRAIIREHQEVIPLRVEREWDGEGDTAVAWWVAYIGDRCVLRSREVRITETPDSGSRVTPEEAAEIVAVRSRDQPKEAAALESLERQLRGIGFTRRA